MKSTMEILTKLQENSQKNHDEIFTRLYRYLLRPDIYFIAYQHLYSNKGAGTKGVNDDTADGFSEQYVTAIIEALRTGSYEPKPVRRTYIQKKNGKLRPLGLPVFADFPERRSNLVLDYFYAHLVSFDIVAVFQFTDAADIQTNRGIKLQRITAGCRFGIAEHHANLVTQLVDEYTCRVSLIDRSRQLTKCLGH